MQTNATLAHAKKTARALTRALARQGLALGFGQALEVQAHMAGFADWNAYCAKLGKPDSTEKQSAAPVSSQAAPTIADVDFLEVHAVIFSGQCFNVEWREEAVLEYLGHSEREDYADWADSTALSLHYEADGLVFEESLTLEQLDGLVWDTKEQAFKGEAGEIYQFFVSTPFGQAGTPGKAEPELAPPVNVDSPAEGIRYKLYEFVLNDGAVTYSAAPNADFATVECYEQGQTKPGQHYPAREVDPELHGPYVVEANFGFYNEFASLSKAIEVAQGLLNADESLDGTRVLMPSGVSLVRFSA